MTTFILVVVSFIAGALLGTVYGRKVEAKAQAEAVAVLDNLRKHV